MRMSTSEKVLEGENGERLKMVRAFVSRCERLGLPHLKAKIATIVATCRAAGTLSQYLSAERRRHGTAHELGFETADAWSLIFHLMIKGPVSASSIRSQLAAYKFFVGEPHDDVRSLIAMLHESSMRRTPAKSKDGMFIKFEDLTKIICFAESSSVCSVRRAGLMAVLLYGGQLRISELLDLRDDDIQLQGDIVVLTVKSSKTDQKRVGRRIYLKIGAQSTSAKLFFPAIAAASGWIFKGKNGNKLSYTSAARDLKYLVESAGVLFRGTHAFRRGATSAAVEQGAPLELVQRRGRWKSPSSMVPYISDSLAAQGGCNKLP